MVKSYYRFRGDLFKVNYNFEQSATLVSESDNEAIITGVFRTSGDFGALIWGSKDYIKNDYISYKTNYDYRNTKLTFKADFSGYIQPYSDLESEQSLTILNNDGTTNYVALGFCSSTSQGNASMKWTGNNGYLGENWIKWGSVKATWSKDGKQGTCIERQDFEVDYVKGIVSVCAGNKVPYLAEINITFEYSNFDNYIIDFNNLYTTLSPYTGVKLDTSNISEIRFPLIPKNYDKTGVMIANSTEEEYSVKFTEIAVVNGFLNNENPEIEATGYSIAEDYDSTYSYCPRRLAREMRKLGYSEIVDLYIGASHFYCKNGVTGTKITDYKDMTLDSSKGINIAFRSWLESYCKNLLLNNVSSLVISVSLENLEMPEVWRQKLWNGQDGETGWQPPTNFYSLTNPDVREYIRNVSNECLEIVGQSGLEKIFQFGEPWWWCQSFKGGDVSVSNPSSPLAIYDSYTQSKFESDNGYKMPIYSTSTFEMDEQSTKVANWLNEQLQDYSNFMKSIAENNGALFTVLYYPPSTLSNDVPKFVNAVNTPFNAWNNNQLDYLELEDYAWVTGNSPQHQEVYTFGQDVLGYPTSKQQYFAGYVDNPGDAYEEWNLIFQAAEEAKEQGFANVFIWAGTQVREYNVTKIQSKSSSINQNNNNITTACDTEYIVTLEEAHALVNAGYTVIGRTLNGDNPLSLNELENIMTAGLNVVPIYISNMNITKDVYENTQQGTLDAVNAATLAANLGLPTTATIYFTANYSNTQGDLDYIVLPYFKGVKEQYTMDKTQYKIGIYGPRNTCLVTEKAGYTTLSFVEDASNINSGNKGYNMPTNWAFNQTATNEIDGLGINEDISSGKDLGTISINFKPKKVFKLYENGVYNRENVYAYATNPNYTTNSGNVDIYNHNYFNYGDPTTRVLNGILASASDCANFASQCIHAGGVLETANWYFKWIKYPIRPNIYVNAPDPTPSWIRVQSLMEYLVNAGYAEEVIIFNTLEDLKVEAINYGVQKGDVAFLAYNYPKSKNISKGHPTGIIPSSVNEINSIIPSEKDSSGKIVDMFHHAMIITTVENNEVKISSHTNPRLNWPVNKYFFENDPADKDPFSENYFVVIKMKNIG